MALFGLRGFAQNVVIKTCVMLKNIKNRKKEKNIFFCRKDIDILLREIYNSKSEDKVKEGSKDV